MPKNVGTIIKRFIFCQIFILFLGITLVILFISWNYVRNYSQLWLIALDKTTHLISHHIQTKDELVQIGEDSDFIVYVIDQKDGSILFTQGERSLEEASLWERYRTKHIYEMQKQKRGWIFYPAKSPLQFNVSQKIIRYLPLEKQGWIVAVESLKNSEVTIISRLINWKHFIFFIAIIILGGFLYTTLTKMNVVAIRRVISDSIETSFMNFANEDLLQKDFETEVPQKNPAPSKDTQNVKEFLSGNISVPQDQVNVMQNIPKPEKPVSFIQDTLKSEEDSNYMEAIPEKDTKTNITKDILKPKEETQAIEDIHEVTDPTPYREDTLVKTEKQETATHDVPSSEEQITDNFDLNLLSHEKKLYSEALKKKNVPFEDDKEDSYDSAQSDLTINLKNINSPILKKIIKNIRGKK